jgi:hypothetical protein
MFVSQATLTTSRYQITKKHNFIYSMPVSDKMARNLDQAGSKGLDGSDWVRIQDNAELI